MQSVVSTFQKYVAPDEIIVLAVSGGVDSMVLLDVVSQVHPLDNIIVAHFDHSIRWVESDGDRELVANTCNSKKIKFEVKKMNIAQAALDEKMSIEEVARKYRYEFLDWVRIEHGVKYILTAHHRDDRMETALFHMIRGTRLQGIHALGVLSGSILRPMISTDKSEIMDYAISQGIQYREDHTNQEDIYTRNHIRHNIIPEFARINPGFRQSISSFVDYTEGVQDWINSQIVIWIQHHILDQKFPDSLYEIDRDAFLVETPFFQKECIRYWYEISNYGTLGLSEGWIDDVLQMLHNTPSYGKKTHHRCVIEKRGSRIVVLNELK